MKVRNFQLLDLQRFQKGNGGKMKGTVQIGSMFSEGKV